jgi:hypothetical protein
VESNSSNPAHRSDTPGTCPACGGRTAAEDFFCRRCGRSLSLGSKWYYDPLWIWVLGLFVLGPLALPLAWRSPKMPALHKITFTVAVTALTTLLVILCYIVFSYIWSSLAAIREAGRALWP